jgi:PAS domain S-box-containing protein
MSPSPPTDLEKRARALLWAVGYITYDNDYTTGVITWDGPFTDILGYTPREMGGTVQEWIGRLHPDDSATVRAEIAAAIAARRTFQAEYRFRAKDGSYRWFNERAVFEFDGAGNLARSTGVMRDVTARRLTEQERDSIFELSLDLLCVASVDGWFRRVNPAFTRVLGYSPDELTTRPYLDFVHPEDRGQTAVQAGRLALGRAVMSFDNRYICKDGSVRWLSWNAVLSQEDRLIYAVARDMTEQKETERHERLMARELNHRVKNTLAGVMAAIEQSRAGARSADDLAERLSGRVRAMATAHELLARSRWKGANLRRAALAVLTPFGADSGRITLEGPDVALPARAAPAVCMTLHELATNAVRHGALSVPGGRVDLSWSTADTGPRARLRLLWQERAGPAVSPPEQRGYGTLFIENSVPYEVGGSVSLAFEPAGVRCEILCPLYAPGTPGGPSDFAP